MIATLVYVKVKKEFIEDFKQITLKNHNESVKEPCNLRFDVLQDQTDETRFVLYEAYETEEAALKHKETAHYLQWRETVADWMEEPRKGVKHNILAPEKK